MKQEAISKINKMGHVGQILALIVRILLIIAAVVMIVCSAAISFVPKEFVKVTLGGTAQVNVNLRSIGVSLSQEDQDSINNNETQVSSGTMDASGMEYRIEKMTADEEGLFIDSSADKITYSLRDSMWVMLVGTLAVILSLITVCFIGSLCKALRYCQTPFEDNVIKKMQNLAISLIPWAFFKSISDGMTAGMMYHKMQVHLGVDLDMVLVIVIIFALTYIFKYGAVLQQESDETL